jgi:hypothetical protein
VYWFGIADLYRLQLIAALGFRAKTVREEWELLAELDHFFVQAFPRNDLGIRTHT